MRRISIEIGQDGQPVHARRGTHVAKPIHGEVPEFLRIDQDILELPADLLAELGDAEAGLNPACLEAFD
jgi:hypothetical protein